ncbi:bifunctional DNA primase/polymerase [Methylobacterium sp. GC_Met_2]|uniref:bifunctional DNA primase/polymerase n=1 Tax=Methylobacterium sp. GC_Met_2 TaxID=2937376 RepID=UPI00226AFED0|nr:bifunctional DNA primase/polymerase [Methylobacterium sp. GC_Met_2]
MNILGFQPRSDDTNSDAILSAVNLASNGETFSCAQSLKKLGLQLVRLKPGTKEPFSKAWQNSNPPATDFFQTAGLGVQLGTKSNGLVDIDLDCPEARLLAPHLFQGLVAFRRQSLPREAPGHLLCRCIDVPADAQKVLPFGFRGTAEEQAAKILSFSKSVVLELRAGRGYAVFPPSLIPVKDADGKSIGLEKLVWNDGGPPQEIPMLSWDKIRHYAGLLAFLSVALHLYPRETGGRDDYCFRLSGALLDIGINAEHASRIIGTLANLSGDEEADVRMEKAGRAAERKMQNKPVSTLRSFISYIGLEACEHRVRDWLNLEKLKRPEQSDVPADAISIDSHELHEKVLQVNKILQVKSKNVYKRGGQLVRVYTLEKPERFAKKVSGGGQVLHLRPAGLFEIREATPGWMAIEASRVGGKFCKRNRLVEPPTELFQRLRDYADSLDLPDLRGITMTPTLTCDRPGYDADTGMFHAYPEGLFPPGSPEPTRSDAEAAIQRLGKPLRGFPFLDAASRSVAISAIISAVLRADLPGVPIHLIDAPSAGTGKTLMAKLVGIVATGVLPTILTYTGDEEEDRKQLSVALMAGAPVILFDNISKPLRGDFLAGVITSPEFDIRILGRSENVKIDTRSLILGSGNNTIVQGDLGRRTVRCRLDANVERPEEREFDFDPLDEVLELRPQLVIDALTIVRAYLRANRPTPMIPLGSFEVWSRSVREPLIWLGLADPAGTRLAFEDFDPEREVKTKLVQALFAGFGCDRWFKLAEIDQASTSDLAFAKEAITALLYEGRWGTRQLGKLLSRHRDGPLLGVSIRTRMDRHASVMEYKLDGEPSSELLKIASSTTENAEEHIPF